MTQQGWTGNAGGGDPGRDGFALLARFAFGLFTGQGSMSPDAVDGVELSGGFHDCAGSASG